ncbi:MAG: Ig-like domain-containing protein [Nocardioides sp.]
MRSFRATRLRRAFRGRMTAVSSGLALVMATTTVVVLAVSADGYRSHEARLNDGGVWVTSNTDGYFGRVNKPIGQMDGGLFAEEGADLDVVQDGDTVLGLNRTGGSLAPIDPATVQHPEGEVAGIVGSADVVARGNTIAVTDPDDGSTWATVADPDLGPVSVVSLDRESTPLHKAGGAAAMSVTTGGDVVVVSADDDSLTTMTSADGGFREPVATDLPEEIGETSRVTTVGETPVVLDQQAGRVWAVPGGEAAQPERSDVPVEGVLQQPGPSDDTALLATPDSLLTVPLAGGEPTVLADGFGGRPAAPVRLGACQYGAWSGGGGTVVTACDGAEPRVIGLGTPTSDLVFRVNRDQVLLNDRTTGAVWNIDTEQPTRLDDWDAFKRKATEEDDEEENEDEQQGDQSPPVANPDTLGARPGRTTVLHPLDNDTAPGGRLLSIRSVERVTGSGSTVTISPDGQTVLLTLSPGAGGRVSFVYYIDDGRDQKTAHATVTVPIRQPSENGDPRLRLGFEPRSWTVPAGGVLDVPVLPDWRDRSDGDPIAVTSAEAASGVRSGADARPTASGQIRITAPAVGGPLEILYTISDGLGSDVERTFVVNVQDPKDRQAFPGVAEPDVISGQVGEPITIAPLDNDQPGSDPLTPDARLSLAGRLLSPGGAEATTDLVEGTVTFTASVADTYFLEYDAAYGNAPLAQGKIRVDVRNPERPPDAPVAMPDTALISGQNAILVDVLRNDLDPSGGLLTVQQATARDTNILDVAVVDGRWVRIAARQGQLTPNPSIVRYEITNGTRSGIQGEIVVTQREPERDVPVTEKDAVTVRAGAAVAVPALDNDFSPSGGELSLVEHVADESSGQLTVRPQGDQKVAEGQAFVTGNFVRYVAPPDLADVQVFTITYLAANIDGVSAPGKIEVTVVPADRANQPPEPPTLEGRVVAGDSVTLRLPGAGVDPDGDAVTLLGISSAPELGRVVRTGANTIFYQSFPSSVGTEQFTYEVTDSFGGTASGTVRVAVAPPGAPQPPLAVDDPLTVEPGRQATVDILANDHIASGDSVSARLLDPPPGAELETPVGPLKLDSPSEGGGQTVKVVYEVTNGIASSRGTVTLRTAEPYNNPPVAFDAFGNADDGDAVVVDVLETAYDPDGPSGALVVAEVLPPAGVEASVSGSTITVTRGEQPVVVPFRVEDADGGATTASLYVPPASNGLPYVTADGLIELDPGDAVELDLGDYVENPSGGEVQFTLKNRIWSSPVTSVGAAITGGDTFRVEANQAYEGPGGVTFEVTTGTSVNDPEGRTAILTVPVQVGEDRPVLLCPDTPIEVPQGTTIELDIASICHVWTADPADADELVFVADWKTSIDGLSIIEPEGAVIEIAADGNAQPGVTADLEITTEGGVPATLPVRVVKTPPPSLSAIRISDMEAGETRTIDLSPYLVPGVPEAEPTLVTVTPETDLDVQAVKSGPAELTLTTGPKVDGTARFRIVMSDVAGSLSEDRQVTGFVELEVLDVPDVPTAPVPGRTVRSEEVTLSWRAPQANGAPIEYYEVRDDRGEVTRCGSTACDVTGLVNGDDYRFQVRATNAVGSSDWSGFSAPATPDAKPGIVGPVTMTDRGDGTIALRWTPPTTQTSAIEKYYVTWPGGPSGGQATPEPRITIGGLNNNAAQAFTVVAENALDYGTPRTSDTFQSIGTPGTPMAPIVTDQQTGDGETAVTIAWQGVDANGPTRVVYTVLRDGRPLAQCTNIQATSCDDTGLTYDGTIYNYAVRATNNGAADDAKNSPVGPSTQWAAVGEPAGWDESWSVAPTGQNTMARVTFTVPPSRGAQSQVSILVDGVVRHTQEWTGAQTYDISVDDNDRPHTVSLRVCNEKGTCSDSAGKPVQAYGPFVAAHIISARENVREVDANTYEVWWTITVDNNGDPGTVRITSRSGDSDAIRDETQQMSVVDVQTFDTQKVRLDAFKSDIIRVRLSDAGPARAEVSKEFRYTTPERKDPTVTISKGTSCSDDPASSKPACGGGSGGSIACTDASCGKIAFSSANYTDDRVYCQFYDSVSGQYGAARFIDSNRTYEPGPYYGFPGRQVWVVCNGVESNHYTWPSS